MSSKEAVRLEDTRLLGTYIDNDIKYFFYEAKLAREAPNSEIAECLKFRYQKYGDVIFQRKDFTGNGAIIFTLMEALVPNNFN